jgi:hypothetical protein
LCTVDGIEVVVVAGKAALAVVRNRHHVVTRTTRHQHIVEELHVERHAGNLNGVRRALEYRVIAHHRHGESAEVRVLHQHAA